MTVKVIIETKGATYSYELTPELSQDIENGAELQINYQQSAKVNKFVATSTSVPLNRGANNGFPDERFPVVGGLVWCDRCVASVPIGHVCPRDK